MANAMDFQIYQRDAQGYASIYTSGTLPDIAQDDTLVFTRVIREEDNMPIVPWTQCEQQGRNWQVTLRVPQGGLYRIETSEGPQGTEWRNRIQNICHVGVGELFLVAGQSNISGYGRDVAYDPPQLGVHSFGNNGKWRIAMHPLTDSIDIVYPENREHCPGASPMLSFARQVQRALNVPVGLVQASLGGTPLSVWHPDEDGRMFRAMMRRLEVTGPVGAVLWYQGCEDALKYRGETYLPRFISMIEAWRRELGPVPFMTVQLNRYANLVEGEQMDHSWGLIREAQRQAARTVPDVYIVSATDLYTTDIIHNSAGSNVILGERMARAYLHGRYGLPGVCTPDIEHVRRIDDTHLFVELTPNSDTLVIDIHASGMDVVDDQGLFPCCAAEARDGGILLTLSRPCGQHARLHMLWRASPPMYPPRSRHGTPMLSCYGVPVE